MKNEKLEALAMLEFASEGSEKLQSHEQALLYEETP
jgi:hypothetical protein